MKYFINCLIFWEDYSMLLENICRVVTFMKKIISFAICLVMALGIYVTPVFAADDIKVFVNGQHLIFDVPPVIVGGRTLVPMRAIFEELGAEIEWEANFQMVTATRGNTLIRLQIDNNIASVNGVDVTLDVPARLVDGRTLVPLRFVGESLDCDVQWDGNRRQVTITGVIPTAEPTPIAPTPTPTQILSIEINGVNVRLDTPPVIIDGVIFAPVRAAAEIINYDADWLSDTNTIIFTSGTNTISIQLGARTFTINGKERPLDVPAQVIDARTMIPLAAILESVGFMVEHNIARNLITVTSPAASISTTVPTQPPSPTPILAFLTLNREYKAADGMTVVLKSIDINRRQGSTRYTISYTLKNETSDKRLTEGSFKLFFTNDTGENQFGFFNDLFPGDIVEREYTFEALNSLTPLVLE
jgi:hypothetical protein